MNLREQAVARLDRTVAQLDNLSTDELTDDELLLPIREEAANLERFVKQLKLGLGSRTTLEVLIEKLNAQGLPSEDADALHSLRKAANAGKHDPRKRLDLADVLSILAAARAAVAKVGVEGSALGAADEAPQPRPRRLAISVFDYPTHGEVHYQIDSPLNDGRVVHIDSYQAQFRAEPLIKEALSANGRCC